jgi:DNA-binding transcriptional ArsR family regulator
VALQTNEGVLQLKKKSGDSQEWRRIKIEMNKPGKEGKRVNKASYTQELTCKIPSSYKISPETLEKVKVAMNEDVSDIVTCLKALSNPIRLRILKALRVTDLCVCVLVELLDCEYSKFSYHLGAMKRAGLVDCTKEGNFLIYHLTVFGAKTLESMEKLF